MISNYFLARYLLVLLAVALKLSNPKVQTMFGKVQRLILASVISVTCSLPAHAGVIFSITEVGSDVFIEGAGSYDLTGANLIGGGVQDGFINSSLGLAVGGPFQSIDAYQLTLNPGAFGTGAFVNGLMDTGDVFGLDVIGLGGFLTVADGYTSGALAGSTTIFGQSFASLGLTRGTFVYGIPSDTLTVRVGAIPEPASIALLGLGLAGLGYRRKIKTV
jgi:hypothetical protein